MLAVDERPVDVTVVLAPLFAPGSSVVVGVSAMVLPTADATADAEAPATSRPTSATDAPAASPDGSPTTPWRSARSERLETLGRLTSGVAHDFNNMLAAITGYADVARHERDLEGVRAAVEDIDHVARRAAALTRQLLTFGRRDAQPPAPIDLVAVIGEFAPLLQRVIGSGIRVETTLSPGPLTVCADQVQLEQILLNLATNGRDAMRKGGVLTIAVSVVPVRSRYRAAQGELEPGRHVSLAVSDTGCGLPDGIRDRIFEPFFTTRAAEGGTGLGLATVGRIVRELRGAIDVYSEVGVGTTFNVLLPVVANGADCAGGRDRAVARPAAASSSASEAASESLPAERDGCMPAYR
jgi:signal transduction histidine kinase